MSQQPAETLARHGGQVPDPTTLRGGFGALVTFGIKGGQEAGQKFTESLERFSHLANIGDAKSPAMCIASGTHSQLNAEELAVAGVTQDAVCRSGGVQHIDDIFDDLNQALAKSRDAVAA